MSEENKPTPQSEADKEKELAAKRNAFLRYMTIIFAVAFLLVLISLVLQAHTAKAALSDLKESNSSALSNAAVNAELLQDENRKLQEELDSTKKLLADEQEKAKTQEESIAQLEQELEALRNEHAEASESSEGTQEAYDALLTALRDLPALMERVNQIADQTASLPARVTGRVASLTATSSKPKSRYTDSSNSQNAIASGVTCSSVQKICASSCVKARTRMMPPRAWSRSSGTISSSQFASVSPLRARSTSMP